MIPRYFDAHCHIQFEPYDADREALIGRMQEEGVAGLVVGVDIESSKKAVALAEKHEHLYASIGLHPNYEKNEWYDPAPYKELAHSSKVVAIGECGLDYFRPVDVNEEVKKKQKNILDDQIRLATELDKPLIIHARPSKGTQHPVGYPAVGDAYQDLIEILKAAKEKHPKLRGDVHFFVGGVAEMQALVALDFTVSFTAVITFARDYDEVIRATPLTHILSETDAPYVAPASRRGERNDPLAAIEVVNQIAAIRGEDPDTIQKSLLENVRQLFAL